MESKISSEVPAALLSLPTPTGALANQTKQTLAEEASQPQSNEYQSSRLEAGDRTIASTPTDVIATEVSTEKSSVDPSVFAKEETQEEPVLSISVNGADEVVAGVADQKSYLREPQESEDVVVEESLSGLSPVADSTRVIAPQPGDLLEKIRQRAAKSVVDVARNGQLGAMLDAARAYVSMADDNIFSLETGGLPLAAETIAHGFADVPCTETPLDMGAPDGCLSDLVVPVQTGPDFQNPLSNTGTHEDFVAPDEWEHKQAGSSLEDQEGYTATDEQASSSVLEGLRKQAAIGLLKAAHSHELCTALQAQNQAASAPFEQEDKITIDEQTQSQAVSSPLDRLRKRAAAKFLKAAQSHELLTALQVATDVTDQSSALGQLQVEQKEGSLIQQLRERAAQGMAAAARSDSLGGILQRAAGNDIAAPEGTPIVNQHAQSPQRVPKAPKTPRNFVSQTPRTQGSGGVLGRQMVPAPTGLPTPSGECSSVKSAVGRPGLFRRRHSRTSSKILL
jgi:hypothetical protein